MIINSNDPNFNVLGTDLGGADIYYFNGTPFTGIVETYFSNGNLQSEIESNNGYTDGLHREYYLNGQVMQEYYTRNNRLVGTFKAWNNQGVLTDHGEYDNNGNLIQDILNSNEA